MIVCVSPPRVWHMDRFEPIELQFFRKKKHRIKHMSWLRIGLDAALKSIEKETSMVVAASLTYK